ncbi:hypothetical protein [Actinokineospora sp. NPDC004072]
MTRALRARTRRRWAGLGGVLAGFMAVWAYAGAVGVIGGGVDFGPDITARLPWESTTVAGIALLACVAAPMTAACALVWRGSGRAPRALVVAGVLLAGWIVVQLAVIRTFSWLQPFCLGYAIVVAALGVMSTTDNPKE